MMIVGAAGYRARARARALSAINNIMKKQKEVVHVAKCMIPFVSNHTYYPHS